MRCALQLGIMGLVLFLVRFAFFRRGGNKLGSSRLALFVKYIRKSSVYRLVSGRGWKFEFLNLINNALSQLLIVHIGIYHLRRNDLTFRGYVPVNQNSTHNSRIGSFQMFQIAVLNFRVVFDDCVSDLVLFVRSFHFCFF